MGMKERAKELFNRLTKVERFILVIVVTLFVFYNLGYMLGKFIAHLTN